MAQSPQPSGTQEQRVEAFVQAFRALRAEMQKVIVGHDDVVEPGSRRALRRRPRCCSRACPGSGKTLLIETLSESLDLSFSRIQFTPGPDARRHHRHQHHRRRTRTGGSTSSSSAGPIFGHILLADEVNRATPKTQSALLEAMQEGAVTVSGTAHPLPAPFFVLATQNPHRDGGTYPLPEAQLDRFLVQAARPLPGARGADRDHRPHHPRARMVEVQRVMTGPEVLRVSRAGAGDPDRHPRARPGLLHRAAPRHPQWERAPEAARRFVRYGASPRGAQALVLGRQGAGARPRGATT